MLMEKEFVNVRGVEPHLLPLQLHLIITSLLI
jgi:hypothetical protein